METSVEKASSRNFANFDLEFRACYLGSSCPCHCSITGLELYTFSAS